MKTTRKAHFHRNDYLRLSFSRSIAVALGDEIEIEETNVVPVNIMPPDEEVVRYESDSYVAHCEAVNSRKRWLSPLNKLIEHHTGRVHIEHFDHKLALIIKEIKKIDEGDWVCEAEEGGTKKSFKLIVNSKRECCKWNLDKVN